MVVLSMRATGSPIWSNTEAWGQQIAVMPEGARPASSAFGCALVGMQGWDKSVPGQLTVNTAGSVTIDCKGGAPWTIVGQVVYVVP